MATTVIEYVPGGVEALTSTVMVQVNGATRLLGAIVYVMLG